MDNGSSEHRLTVEERVVLNVRCSCGEFIAEGVGREWAEYLTGKHMAAHNDEAAAK